MSLIAPVRENVSVAWSRFTQARRQRAEMHLASLALGDRYGHRMPIVHSTNDFFLTADGAWGAYQLSCPRKEHREWRFLSRDSQRQRYRQALDWFNRSFPAGKDNSGHIVVTNRVHSAAEWRDAVLKKYPNRTKYLAGILQDQVAQVDQREFYERDVYLFSRLGHRTGGPGLDGQFQRWVTWALSAWGVDMSAPAQGETSFWSEIAEHMTGQLSRSHPAPQPIPHQDLEWVVRHQDSPAMITPAMRPADNAPWGAGEWRTTLSSYAEEVRLPGAGATAYPAVRFTGPTSTEPTYAVYLPVAKIPSKMYYSANWAHTGTLPFAVGLSLHFERLSPDASEKRMTAAIQKSQTQAAEDSEAGYAPDDKLAIQSQELRQANINASAAGDSSLRWQAVFSVADADPARLRDKVSALVAHFKQLKIELVVPNDDQRELFYSSMPGSLVEVDSWIHTTAPAYLANSGVWLNEQVGDLGKEVGFHEGHLITEAWTPGAPVRYDLLNLARKGAPNEVVIAASGLGKTVSRGCKPVWMDAHAGVTQVVWDPKGDFKCFQRYQKQLLLEDVRVRVIDLRDHDTSISLDLYFLAEHGRDEGFDERASVVSTGLRMLCQMLIDEGTVTGSFLQRIVRRTMESCAANGVDPTMQATLDLLEEAWRSDGAALAGDGAGDGKYRQDRMSADAEMAEAVWTSLSQIKTTSLGGLLFRDPREATALELNEGDLLIFNAPNLETPEGDAKPQSEKECLALVIAGAMTDFIRSLAYSHPDEMPIVLTFDEWHAIKRTGRADSLVKWLRRVGRSKTIALRQMSQYPQEFEDDSFSVMWIGGAENREDAAAMCRIAKIEENEENIKTLLKLGVEKDLKGRFLLTDGSGVTQLIQTTFVDDVLIDFFETDAERKRKIREALGVAA